ncbi:Uncharacterised protein [Mycobacterium tuberculosis]|nr:Uncharacterised protein [Mycobacterium tuberculosis]
MTYKGHLIFFFISYFLQNTLGNIAGNILTKLQKLSNA